MMKDYFPKTMHGFAVQQYDELLDGFQPAVPFEEHTIGIYGKHPHIRETQKTTVKLHLTSFVGSVLLKYLELHPPKQLTVSKDDLHDSTAKLATGVPNAVILSAAYMTLGKLEHTLFTDIRFKSKVILIPRDAIALCIRDPSVFRGSQDKKGRPLILRYEYAAKFNHSTTAIVLTVEGLDDA